MKWFVGILLLILVLLQSRLWFSDSSLIQVWRLEDAVEEQLKENEQLRERNRALEAEVIDLKTGTEAIEERARSELGMIKKGETFYQTIEKSPASQEADKP
jgi:cell division protein FtsB